MPADLRDVTRDFGRGDATLETLRAAAHAERIDRRLADAILRLIADWERKPGRETALTRNLLRARVEDLVPPAPPPPPPPSAAEHRRPPGESIYEAGLRGQRRRG